MSYIFVDERIDYESLSAINNISGNIIKVPCNHAFDNAVCSHPDMNILKINDKIFTMFDVDDKLKREYKVDRVEATGDFLKYPNDVLLNAAVVGNDFICRIKSIYVGALEYAKDLGMQIINVNQGYVKCNISVVNENDKAVITEDENIAGVLRKHSYDVLLLKTHCVELIPYEYGFIGGASGIIEKKIYFTGNIKAHSEYEAIKNFCNRHDTEIVSLNSRKLYDYGSIICI